MTKKIVVSVLSWNFYKFISIILLIGVSRPFLVKLLESGELAHRIVGKHRRVLLQDVMQYKENIDRARNETLNELVVQAQELNMGYQ